MLDWLNNDGWSWLLFNLGIGLIWLIVVIGVAAALLRHRVATPHRAPAHPRRRTR